MEGTGSGPMMTEVAWFYSLDQVFPTVFCSCYPLGVLALNDAPICNIAFHEGYLQFNLVNNVCALENVSLKHKNKLR